MLEGGTGIVGGIGGCELGNVLGGISAGTAKQAILIHILKHE